MGIPYSFVKTAKPAVQGVIAVVNGELVSLTIEFKLAVADAVSIASAGGAEVGILCAFITLKGIEA